MASATINGHSIVATKKEKEGGEAGLARILGRS